LKKRIVRTREVIIETEEEIALSNQDHRSGPTWCPACRRPVEMVTPERAAEKMALARAALPAESDKREAICSCISRR
jgi:hypothetical protein